MPGVFGSKPKVLYGTAYLGRILISFNLMHDDNPDLSRVNLPIFREAKKVDYVLRVDIYRLQGLTGDYSKIKVWCQWGGNEIKKTKSNGKPVKKKIQKKSKKPH